MDCDDADATLSVMMMVMGITLVILFQIVMMPMVLFIQAQLKYSMTVLTKIVTGLI